MKILAILAASAVLSAAHPHATPVPQEPPRETQSAPAKEPLPEKAVSRDTSGVEAPPVSTRHTISVNGKNLEYTARAGYLPIVNEAGETEAHIFFISYTKEGGEAAHRPLIFAFNGGPGSSAVWLHLGAIGPKRVEMLPDGSMPQPPFRLVDNESTWLESADLVFIDPVGTGFSRATKPDLTKKFTTVQGDVESVGKFIRLYLTRFERWQSPLFLAGESYGSFRAAGLSDHLAERGIALNGIIMVSAILNMQTAQFHPLNDLPYVLYLPSYAATAWYHKKLPADLQADLGKTLQQAEQWAQEEYAPALAKGSKLSAQQRREVVDELVRFTGLDRALIENRNMRIDNFTYARELLRDNGEVVGFLDSRFAAANPKPSSTWAGFDPTIATIRPPYTTTFNSYVAKDLGFKTEREYFILGEGIGRWDWEVKNAYADVTEDLAQAMAKNPYMRILIASGVFDLATPHFATEYTIDHLNIPPSGRNRISTRTYRTGHMMYLDHTAVADLKRDVEAFIAESVVSKKQQ